MVEVEEVTKNIRAEVAEKSLVETIDLMQVIPGLKRDISVAPYSPNIKERVSKAVGEYFHELGEKSGFALSTAWKIGGPGLAPNLTEEEGRWVILLFIA